MTTVSFSLLNTHYMPITELNLHMHDLIRSLLPLQEVGRDKYNFHFAEEEMEAQRGARTCPKFYN